MTLIGKGFFIWQIPRCEGGNAGAIAAKAVAAGLSHVLIKIADGPNWVYNYDHTEKVDHIPPVGAALRAAGVEVWGWHYVRGDDPVGEARIAVQRTKELGLDGYVIDAEIEYRKKSKAAAARRFIQELRRGLPHIPVALSSFRYPRSHHELPYDEFLAGCDYAMPQVYFEKAHNPEEQLDRSVEQYMGLANARPVIPTAPTYAAHGWRPTAEEITRFLTHTQSLGLSAVNAWSWDFSSRKAFQDLWEAVAQFDWPAKPPIADMPERLIGRLNEANPGLVAGLYLENAAHVTGARTISGQQPIGEWYHTLFTRLLPNARFEITGKTGSGHSRHFSWKAESDRGAVKDGTDTLSLREGQIQYHYTYFTIT
jgi:hypothetical protein